MIAGNPDQIARLVQQRLNQGGAHTSRVRVLSDEVRPATDGDWWFVPVSYQEDPSNMYIYYDAFARIEEELEDSEHVSVLLVPRITHPPA